MFSVSDHVRVANIIEKRGGQQDSQKQLISRRITQAKLDQPSPLLRKKKSKTLDLREQDSVQAASSATVSQSMQTINVHHDEQQHLQDDAQLPDLNLDSLYPENPNPAWRRTGTKSQKTKMIQEMLVNFTRSLRDMPQLSFNPYDDLQNGVNRLPRISNHFQQSKNTTEISSAEVAATGVSRERSNSMDRPQYGSPTNQQQLQNINIIPLATGKEMNQVYSQVQRQKSSNKQQQKNFEQLKSKMKLRNTIMRKFTGKSEEELNAEVDRREAEALLQDPPQANNKKQQKFETAATPTPTTITSHKKTLTFEDRRKGKSLAPLAQNNQNLMTKTLRADMTLNDRDVGELNSSQLNQKQFKKQRQFKHDTSPAGSVQELVSAYKSEHKVYRDKKNYTDKIMMKGRSHYRLPDHQSLQKHFNQTLHHANENFIKELSKSELGMGGRIHFYEKDKKQKKVSEKLNDEDQLKQYVAHFSQIADLVEDVKSVDTKKAVVGLAKGIQMKVQENKIKLDLKTALMKNMIKNKQQRQAKEMVDSGLTSSQMQSSAANSPLKRAEDQDEQLFLRRDYAFNKTLEEETKQMSSIADNILRKKEYHHMLKNREVGEIRTKDPRIQYFQECQKEQNLTLPILDKIWKKTLCLQNYFLSEGNIKGLASACEVLDHKLVNRLLLNNNGINGDQFAEILAGMAKLRDFKSLIYKQNTINLHSLEVLRPVLEKRLPHHLEEIKLIDCKVSPGMIARLLENLNEASQIQKLALVNVHHNAESFDKLLAFVQESESLTEIDLSWSVVVKGSWPRFFEVLNENRSLRDVKIGYNQLLEAQSFKLTKEQIEAGLTEVPLTPKNAQSMEGLKNFIKYNPHLIHMDLQMAGLQGQIIRQIGYFLTRATSLRAIHLCGNEGLDPDTISWLKTRIRAMSDFAPLNIQPLPKHLTKKHISPPPKRQEQSSSIMSLFGIQAKKQQQEDPNLQWKELRQGLKLQSIVNSKRMNEINHASTFDMRKCIVTRHIGYKKMIPGAGQWQVFTDQRDECWICGQHILALFVWSPRIGQLSHVRDQKVAQHFKDQFAKVRADDDFMPSFNATPMISGGFTDWHPKPMREVVQFCKENDPFPPDPIPQLIVDGLVRPACGEPLHEKLLKHEEKKCEVRMQAYYEAKWSSVILSIMRYRDPLVANAHALTSISSTVDPGHQMYFHIEFVKPGKHVFVVEHDNVSKILDEQDEDYEYEQRWQKFIADKMTQGKKNEQNFYVHEMLSSFRNEAIPISYKERHTTTVVKKKFKAKQVFRAWIQDTPESLMKAMNYDLKYIDIQGIVSGDQQDASELVRIFAERYSALKEIYHYLQGKSSQYPNIDMSTMRQSFIKALNIDQSAYKMSSYDVALREAYAMAGRGDAELQKKKPGFTRFMFIEVCFRVARNLYATGIEFDSQRSFASRAKMNHVKVNEAFLLFYNSQLKQFQEEQKIDWSKFRDNKLNNYEVELVFTMNLNNINKLYDIYARMNQDTQWKPYAHEYVCIQDCIQLFKIDSKYKLNKKVINKAFALCKQTVISELEQEGQSQYLKLSKVEFLEFLARIAEQIFEDSELEDLPLHEKIEYMLDDILKVIDVKRVKQQITVEEFSESDDDY